MTRPRLTGREWELAREVCTPAQLQVLCYWRDGYGYKRIAMIVGIRRDAVRGRVDRALESLEVAKRQKAA